MNTTNINTVSHFICVWPDGVFCDPDEVMEMSHRSDDYANVPVGFDQADEDAAEAYIARTHQIMVKACN